MELPILEFIRRFSLHFLPDRFQRIRHFGILSSRGLKCYIPTLQAQMGISYQPLTKIEVKEQALKRLNITKVCPCCGQGQMQPTLPFGRDGPPEESYIFQYILRCG